MINKSIFIRFYLFLIAIICFNPNTFAQEKRTFGFGDFWFVNMNIYERDGNLDIVDRKFAKEGIVFKDSLFYLRESNLNQVLLEKLINAPEINSLMFFECKIDFLWLEDITINKKINFWHCKFQNLLILKKIIFEDDVYFSGSEFSNNMVEFDSLIFRSTSNFWGAIFNSHLGFRNVEFQNANFQNIDFNGQTSFENCKFKTSIFKYSTFTKSISFKEVYFSDICDFSGVTIKEKSSFIKVEFKDTVNFFKSNFLDGIDLRRTNFDSVEVIILEDMYYPIGQFNCYWNQLVGENEPKIHLQNYTDDKLDDYKRIERVYLNLRDNFNSLGDKFATDDIMFELAQQKDILIGSFWQRVYGIVLGYGYQPWRFGAFVVLPIIFFFSCIWYLFYFGIIVFIVNPNFESDLVPTKIASVKLPTQSKIIYKREIKYYDHSKIDPKINLLTRLWYVVYFSTSVLLGIRFKREWIKAIPKTKIGSKSFILLVTLEWFLGILLYISFVSYVLSSQFNNIKGVFGI